MPMTVPYAAIAPSRVAPARVRPPRDEELLQRPERCAQQIVQRQRRCQSAYAPGHPGASVCRTPRQLCR